jgi:hypothetical protein
MVQKAAAMVYAGSMHAISFAHPGRTAGRCRLALTVILVATGLAAAGQEPAGFSSLVVTNIAQLRRLRSQGSNARYSIRLEGNVWWANPTQRKLVLHDASGTAEMGMDFPAQPVQSGQRVRLEGNGTITQRGADFRIGAGGSLVAGGASPLRLEVIGRGAFPDLRWIAIGQPLFLGDEDPWAEVEGEVTLVSEQPDGLHMELSAMGGHMRVEVGDVSGLSAVSLLNHRIRAMGFCQSAFTTTGQKVPGMLLVPSRQEIEFIETPAHHDAFNVTNGNQETLPVLTSAAAVNQMKREEAPRENKPDRIDHRRFLQQLHPFSKGWDFGSSFRSVGFSARISFSAAGRVTRRHLTANTRRFPFIGGTRLAASRNDQLAFNI